MEELMQLVGPLLVKQYFIREPITPGERLSATLRFLASGDSEHSMHFQYLFGNTTTSNILSETSAAIWDALHPQVLLGELSEAEWLEIARGYEEKYNFPHCIGSIDGKHIVIQCPDNAGSLNYNYKHSHSIVLLAICDHNCIFRFVDIGAYGRRIDGGIFQNSVIGKKFEAGLMNLPGPSNISDTRVTPLHYCLVGDEAFSLKSYLMRPYPGKDSALLLRRVFNYRLNRLRKNIECSFGTLVNRFRIFRGPINLLEATENIINYVKAALCLHNWLRLKRIKNGLQDSYSYQSGNERSNQVNPTPAAFENISRTGTNNSTYNAEKIREEFCSYFYNEGALEWQNEYV